MDCCIRNKALKLTGMDDLYLKTKDLVNPVTYKKPENDKI